MNDEEVEQNKGCSCGVSNSVNKTELTQGPACLDYKKTVIAQYSNSPTMLCLLDKIDQNIKVCGFFDDFYEKIWNINTAEGFGLDIWGRIVGVNRTVRAVTGFYWGFYEESLLIARPYYDISGYNESLYDKNLAYDKQSEQYYGAVGMFRDLQGENKDGINLEEDFQFNDDDFRKLILAKAFVNISSLSISNINYLLMTLLGNGGCCKECNQQNKIDTICCPECSNKRSIYIQDNMNMSLTIHLNWLPTQREVILIRNAGLLSRPAGVEIHEIDIQVKEVKES